MGLKYFDTLMDFALQYKNVDAVRLLFRYVPKSGSYGNFISFSTNFTNHIKRPEALHVILDNSPSCPAWIYECNYFYNIRTPSDVFILSNHGGLFRKKIYDFRDSILDYDLLHDPVLYGTTREVRRQCAFSVCGLKAYFPAFNPNERVDFDMALVKYRKHNSTRIIMCSGYKTMFCKNEAKLSNYTKEYLEEIKLFKLYSSQPLSLKGLVANVIRNELYPNAVVGSRVLGQVQPGEKSSILPPQVASYITFGLTQENVEKSLEGKWTQ